MRDGMPEDWVERLTVSGDPDEVVAQICRLQAAGADAIALFPVPPDQVDALVRLTATEVLPRL